MKRFAAPHCRNCRNCATLLLGCCRPEELEMISRSKTCQQYQRGQCLFREGSRPLGLYCVHSGHLKIAKVGGDGKEQIIRLAKPGEVLGYRGLLAGTGHSADAVALGEVAVCLIPRAVFFQLIEHNAAFATSLMKLLSRSLGEAEERLLHLAYKPVRERLAEALLLLLRTYTGTDDAPASISVSRQDLASLVGTAKETISRFMAELKEEGIVTSKGSCITVLNPRQLVAIATLYE